MLSLIRHINVSVIANVTLRVSQQRPVGYFWLNPPQRPSTILANGQNILFSVLPPLDLGNPFLLAGILDQAAR